MVLSDTVTTKYRLQQREEVISVVSPIYCERLAEEEITVEIPAEFRITHGDLYEW